MKVRKLCCSIVISIILVCLQTQWNYPINPIVSGYIVSGYIYWAPTRYDWMLWCLQCNIVSSVSQIIGGIMGTWFGLSFLNKRVEVTE